MKFKLFKKKEPSIQISNLKKSQPWAILYKKISDKCAQKKTLKNI